MLKVTTPSPSQPFLTMGTSSSLKPGQEVVVIGSALGTLQNSVSRGIVSGLRNSGGVTLVQSDAAANPGNSGGPMLDRNGRVVGILTAGMRGQEGLNFAVSIDHARDILEGRQTNLGSGQPGPGEHQAVGARRDRERPRAAAGRTAVQAAHGRRGEGRRAARFGVAAVPEPVLQEPHSGHYDREWFAVFCRARCPATPRPAA